jgi:hypothetical protein
MKKRSIMTSRAVKSGLALAILMAAGLLAGCQTTTTQQLAAFCAYRQPEPDEPEYDECLAVKAMTDKNAYQLSLRWGMGPFGRRTPVQTGLRRCQSGLDPFRERLFDHPPRGDAGQCRG